MLHQIRAAQFVGPPSLVTGRMLWMQGRTSHHPAIDHRPARPAKREHNHRSHMCQHQHWTSISHTVCIALAMAHLTEKTLTNTYAHMWRHSIRPGRRGLGSKWRGDGVRAMGGRLVWPV